MTEAEWLACKDPQRMLDFRAGKITVRKLRRFVCACVRHLVPQSTEKAAVDVLVLAEQIADDESRHNAHKHEVLHQKPAAREAVAGVAPAAGQVARTGGEAVYDDVHWALQYLSYSHVDPVVPAGLLRELLGNPFRPVTFSPVWWTETVVSLARRIYESRDFAAMPVLADALEDAGCEDDDILTHCRGPGPHVRGCWVLDLVIGKE